MEFSIHPINPSINLIEIQYATLSLISVNYPHFYTCLINVKECHQQFCTPSALWSTLSNFISLRMKDRLNTFMCPNLRAVFTQLHTVNIHIKATYDVVK
jgi:hypothetical protein